MVARVNLIDARTEDSYRAAAGSQGRLDELPTSIRERNPNYCHAPLGPNPAPTSRRHSTIGGTLARTNDRYTGLIPGIPTRLP